jgi:hypothetical protein
MHLSNEQTQAGLDKDMYDEATLVEVAIPLNMPYLSNQATYQRFNGTIQFNGTIYNYVKRKISNDTLHILCIPNMQQTQLHAAKRDYAKQLSDGSSNGKKSNESQAKKGSFFSEYNMHLSQYQFKDFAITATQNFALINASITDGFIETPGKPPQATA